jgi:hypothetical protein
MKKEQVVGGLLELASEFVSEVVFNHSEANRADVVSDYDLHVASDMAYTAGMLMAAANHINGVSPE